MLVFFAERAARHADELDPAPADTRDVIVTVTMIVGKAAALAGGAVASIVIVLVMLMVDPGLFVACLWNTASPKPLSFNAC